MNYITVIETENKPVPVWLMREVYLLAFGKDYNTDTTWCDLGVAYKHAMRTLNNGQGVNQ